MKKTIDLNIELEYDENNDKEITSFGIKLNNEDNKSNYFDLSYDEQLVISKILLTQVFYTGIDELVSKYDNLTKEEFKSLLDDNALNEEIYQFINDYRYNILDVMADGNPYMDDDKTEMLDTSYVYYNICKDESTGDIIPTDIVSPNLTSRDCRYVIDDLVCLLATLKYIEDNDLDKNNLPEDFTDKCHAYSKEMVEELLGQIEYFDCTDFIDDDLDID